MRFGLATEAWSLVRVSFDFLLLTQICRSEAGRACPLCPGNSDVNLFSYGQGIINLDAEIPDCAFNLGMAQEDLHRS